MGGTSGRGGWAFLFCFCGVWKRLIVGVVQVNQGWSGRFLRVCWALLRGIELGNRFAGANVRIWVEGGVFVFGCFCCATLDRFLALEGGLESHLRISITVIRAWLRRVHWGNSPGLIFGISGHFFYFLFYSFFLLITLLEDFFNF